MNRGLLASGVLATLLGAVIALGLPASPALADQGCPEGLAPIGQAPGPICVPQPGYMGPSPSRAPTYSAPGTPMPQIQMAPYVRPKYYGVHVTDVDRSQLYSSNFNYTIQGALDAALDYCREQTGKQCVALGTFVDQCQAIVINDKRDTYRGLDLDPRLAGRAAMAECARSNPVGQCRLWRLPLCSGLGYGDGNYAGNDNGRTREQIQDEIRIMTAELATELKR